MKIVVLIAALALGAVLFARHKVATQPATTVLLAASPSPAPKVVGPERTPTALRKPIVRTHEVLNQVKERNGTGEF